MATRYVHNLARSVATGRTYHRFFQNNTEGDEGASAYSDWADHEVLLHLELFERHRYALNYFLDDALESIYSGPIAATLQEELISKFKHGLAYALHITTTNYTVDEEAIAETIRESAVDYTAKASLAFTDIDPEGDLAKNIDILATAWETVFYGYGHKILKEVPAEELKLNA